MKGFALRSTDARWLSPRAVVALVAATVAVFGIALAASQSARAAMGGQGAGADPGAGACVESQSGLSSGEIEIQGERPPIPPIEEPIWEPIDEGGWGPLIRRDKRIGTVYVNVFRHQGHLQLVNLVLVGPGQPAMIRITGNTHITVPGWGSYDLAINRSFPQPGARTWSTGLRDLPLPDVRGSKAEMSVCVGLADGPPEASGQVESRPLS